MLKQAFNTIVQNVDSSTDPHRAIKKVVIKSLREETLHHLLSLKLHISLNGLHRVCDTESIEDGEPCTDYSLLDVYANREQYDCSQEIVNMNFVQFATTYEVVNNELTKLPENVIPRIFPTYSPNPEVAYDIVKSHSHDTSPKKDPLCFIINGVAGTGKSYLINAIRNLLQSKCAVIATTGKAAYNIRGITAHSLLKLPVGSKGNKNLTGQSLCRLQENVNDIDYFIIDEYSMLGQVTLVGLTSIANKLLVIMTKYLKENP